MKVSYQDIMAIATQRVCVVLVHVSKSQSCCQCLMGDLVSERELLPHYSLNVQTTNLLHYLRQEHC